MIEGPDGAGKSTLARQLGTDGVWHNGTYAGVSPEDLYKIYDAQISNAMVAAAGGKTIAIDRGPLSEYIYGQVLRGHSRLGLEEVEELLARVDRVGGLRVYVHGNRHTLERRCRERGEDLVDGFSRSQTRELYSLYCGDWPCKIDSTSLNIAA